MDKALRRNGKTFYSFDATSDCPKRCFYCYTWQGRTKPLRCRKIIKKLKYDNDILRLSKDTIEKLNTCGGVRFGADADFWTNSHIKLALKASKECDKVGLLKKTITKSRKWAKVAISNGFLVHLSVDSVDCGLDLKWCLRMRDKYPNVRIRAMCKDPADVHKWAKVADVLTLYHGLRINGFRNMPHSHPVHHFLSAMYPFQVCAQTGRCLTCPIKCRF